MSTEFIRQFGRLAKKRTGTVASLGGGASLATFLALAWPEWKEIQSACELARQVPQLREQISNMRTWQTNQSYKLNEQSSTIYGLDREIDRLKIRMELRP